MSRIICKSSLHQSAYIGPKLRHPLYLFCLRCTWELLFLWFFVFIYFLSVYDGNILGKQTFFFLLTGFAMFDGRKRKSELWKINTLIFSVKLSKILFSKTNIIIMIEKNAWNLHIVLFSTMTELKKDYILYNHVSSGLVLLLYLKMVNFRLLSVCLFVAFLSCTNSKSLNVFEFHQSNSTVRSPASLVSLHIRVIIMLKQNKRGFNQTGLSQSEYYKEEVRQNMISWSLCIKLLFQIVIL